MTPNLAAAAVVSPDNTRESNPPCWCLQPALHHLGYPAVTLRKSARWHAGAKLPAAPGC